MSNEAARHFIVVKIGMSGGNPSVEIREITPGASAAWYSREEAWKLANRLGQPVNVRGGTKHGFLPIFFTALDGTRTQVGKAAANDAPQATLSKPVAPAPTAPAADPATDKQIAFIGTLTAEREFTGEVPSTITKDEAKSLIKSLLAAPKKQTAKAPSTNVEVPAGHYALPQDDGTVKFYKVDHGKAGTRWEGYTFVKVQASDDYYPIRNASQRQEILRAISESPAEFSKLYGQRIGRCGVCHRTLTDDTSIANGIGPVCEAKQGW